MTEVTIEVPQEVDEFLRERGSKLDLKSFTAIAIDYLLDNASWKENLLPQSNGYDWKNRRSGMVLNLPPGTSVRMRKGGKYHYAKVQADDLIYEGQKVSPNEFARTVAGHARDAWRDLWIKRPDDFDYRLADDLRKGGDGDDGAPAGGSDPKGGSDRGGGAGDAFMHGGNGSGYLHNDGNGTDNEGADILPKTRERLTRHQILLFEGDFDRLSDIYRRRRATEVIRTLVRKHLDAVDARFAQRQAEHPAKQVAGDDELMALLRPPVG